MLFYELTRWWAYRRISHPNMKHYVWTTPIILATLVMAFYFLLPIRPHLRGDDGLLKGSLQVLSLLPGFFISALAAVATFGRNEMDETMPAPTPTIMIKYRGQYIESDLTRRMFLTYLFSYLAILSILLTATVVLAPYVAQNAYYLKGLVIHKIDLSFLFFTLKYSTIYITIYFLSSLFITMLHGIYFLCERMHMPVSK